MVVRRAHLALLLAAVLIVIPGCNKKSSEKKEGDAPQAATMGPEVMRPVEVAPAPRPAVVPRPVVAPQPVPPRPVDVAAADPELKESLGKVFDARYKAAAEQAGAQLAKIRGGLDVSKEGQALYAQLLQTVTVLKQMAAQATAGRFEQIPMLATMGYIYAIMGAQQLGAFAKDVARRAAGLMKDMKIGEARKMLETGKAIPALVNTIAALGESYKKTFEALTQTKSDSLRMATFLAITRHYAQASAEVKKVLGPMLQSLAKAEQGADAKHKMSELISKLKL